MFALKRFVLMRPLWPVVALVAASAIGGAASAPKAELQVRQIGAGTLTPDYSGKTLAVGGATS